MNAYILVDGTSKALRAMKPKFAQNGGNCLSECVLCVCVCVLGVGREYRGRILALFRRNMRQSMLLLSVEHSLSLFLSQSLFLFLSPRSSAHHTTSIHPRSNITFRNHGKRKHTDTLHKYPNSISTTSSLPSTAQTRISKML